MAPVDSTQVLRGVNPAALERFSRVTEKPLVSGTPEVLNICAGDGIGFHQYFDTCGIAVRIDGDHLRGLLDLTDSVVVRRPLKSPFLQRHQRRHGQRGGHLRSLGTEARVSFKWLKGKQGGDDGADLSASSHVLYWLQQLQELGLLPVAFAPAHQRIYPEAYPLAEFSERACFPYCASLEEFEDVFGKLQCMPPVPPVVPP